LEELLLFEDFADGGGEELALGEGLDGELEFFSAELFLVQCQR
jgi:hypothetical protein